ncbi:hypothetical protein GW17_00052195, partial [Ensete ventricosum]
CPSPPSPSLRRRRRCPFAVGSRPAKGRPPLQPVLSPLLATGLAAGGNPLLASRCRLALASWPLAVAPMGWPLAVAPVGWP